MARLLGTWELGRGYGHVAHFAPIAHALKAQGHAMPLAARYPPVAEAAPGAPFAQIVEAPHFTPSGATPPALNYAMVAAAGGLGDTEAAITLVRRWLTLFDDLRPDAIVAEHAPLSLLAAHVAGLPAAMIGSGWTVPPAERPLPALMPWQEPSTAALATAEAPADATVRDVCRAFGVAPLDGLRGLLARPRRYLTTLPELDIYGPRRDATYFGVMGGFRAELSPAWPPGKGPLVFVYLPFGNRQAAGLIEALGRLGWPTIWHSRQEPEAALPPNIAATPTPVDVIETLADAALLVGRGGHATACEALIAGRPNLVLPDTLETLLLARRLALIDMGAGCDATEGDALEAAMVDLVGNADVAAALAAARARYLGYRPEVAAVQLAARLVTDLGV